MAIVEQSVTDHYAVYQGDCMEVLRQFDDKSIDLSVYSPPFQGLYVYSSSPRDLSNALDTDEFWEHYDFIIAEMARLTKPGRMTCVHCMDIPTGNTGLDRLIDFPGDVIRHHEKAGFDFVSRRMVWKEPLTVRNRTMTKSLSHKALTLDSTKTSIANADQLLVFRRKGQIEVPVSHEQGLLDYAGSTPIPSDLLEYRGWTGNQIHNKFSQWVWRQYASSIWMDVRIDRVLQYREAKDEEDEKHCHPLQLDVVDRAVTLYSNPEEIVLTPFMGVGSEVYGAVAANRRAIGIELKASYYRQALKNLQSIEVQQFAENHDLFAQVS